MPVSKGKDCVGEEMHRWKHTGLHSGTGKKGKKGKLVDYPSGQKQAVAIALNVCGKSNHSEAIQSLGFSEEAAEMFAEMYDFISSKDAAAFANEGPLGDSDSTPGKQKGKSGRRKQDPQESQATFPTLPKQAPGSENYSDGPMMRARKGKCPPGTRAVGGGFCRNPRPGRSQYFEIEKGKSCPPGSRGAGKGRCRVDFSEFMESNVGSTACPPKKTEAEKQAAKAAKGTTPTKPQTADAGAAQTPAPTVKNVQSAAQQEAKKQQRQACKKQQGN